MPLIRSRFFLPGSFARGAHVDLRDAPLHKLRNVLRARVGEVVSLFNAEAGEWTAQITTLDKKRAELEIKQQLRPAPGSDQSLAQVPARGPWLCFAPIKTQRQDLVVEKACELGVARLIPLRTARCQITRFNAVRVNEQLREAAEQCGRLDVPELSEYQPLTPCMASWPQERRLLVCAEAGKARPLAAFLRESAEAKPALADAILIGPEGGFTPAELDGLAKLPFVYPVGLGPRLLRAETAAITALSLWQAILGDGGERPFRAESF